MKPIFSFCLGSQVLPQAYQRNAWSSFVFDQHKVGLRECTASILIGHMSPMRPSSEDNVTKLTRGAVKLCQAVAFLDAKLWCWTHGFSPCLTLQSFTRFCFKRRCRVKLVLVLLIICMIFSRYSHTCSRHRRVKYALTTPLFCPV